MATHEQLLTLTFDENDLAPSEMCKYDPKRYLNEVANYLMAVASGKRQGTITTVQDGGDAVAASGTITLNNVQSQSAQANVVVEVTAPGQAALSVTIGGATVPYDASGDATVDDVVTGLEAEINNDPTASALVVASANLGASRVDMTTKAKGTLGNGTTLAASAHLTPSAATFSGGIDAVVAVVGGVQASVHEEGVDDDATAVLLAAEIASVQPLVTSTSVGNVVTVEAVVAGTAGNGIGLDAAGNVGTAVVSGVTLAGGAAPTGATLFTIQS